MSTCNVREPQHTVSGDWTSRSTKSLATTRSSSPSRGEAIFHKYMELIHSKSNLSVEANKAEPNDRPFDFFDDEEFAFGINLLNNNVACVGDNITKLIQMAQEPWPDNVKLFQPYEVEQILLPDNASCLAVQAFLKMCNLPFEVEMRWNAEFMSPSGRVPFIKCGAFVVSELEPIVQFAANKGVSLCGKLSTEEKAEMRAYMSLITNVLVNAELYISWVDNETFNAVTKVRNSSVYPWPLGWLQTRAKRNAVIKRLKALHWYDKTIDQVLADVEQCCNSLSQRLGDKDYFFGSSPTPLDALIFGHMRAILMSSGARAGALIKRITSPLLRHLLRCINVTHMSLTTQEEYLITQAFQIIPRRRLSPERTASERSTRIKRSRMSIRNTSKDTINSNSNKDVFGFKPFASKQIIIMTSKENESSTKIDTAAVVDPEVTKSINEIIDDVLDKVDKVVIDDIPEKIDLDNEKNDAFEIIAYPKTMTESKIDSVDAKVNDYLDTIEENDLTDTTNSLEMTLDEGMHIVNDDDYAHIDDPVDVKSLTDDSVSRKIAVGDGINRF
ncbi:uncharacterized protein LOC118279859 isoform X1 [Spodoptera frugiperda]|uniref:Uncharacterized protein LOC118279859 isoform X1 n=1 Tax=Spodoptera frugiperda TaxID=7108 RepID=A0A9R0E332_SPOFR|nr:uncharacterized protein LOC118279859 isoform X1 [Spodoptera frugiperda]